MSFSKTYDKFVLLKKGKIQDREMGKAKMGIVINHSENIFLPQMIITKPEMEEKGEAFVKNEGAIVYDYDSLASFRIQRQSILLDPAEP